MRVIKLKQVINPAYDDFNNLLENSLGFRPNGVSGSLVDCLMVKGSNFNCSKEPLPPRNLALATACSHSFDPLTLRGSMFYDLLAHWEGFKNHDFGIAQKRQKS